LLLSMIIGLGFNHEDCVPELLPAAQQIFAISV
ncbi:MAG: hypothetical protein QOH78_2558, partial [Verrucomicrobiota bacterium]